MKATSTKQPRVHSKEATTTTQADSMFSPFAFRNYRWMWSGTVITQLGQWMQQVAQGWLVYQLTDSAFALGAVGFARGLPMLLISLPGGVLIDRLDRRKLLVRLQAAAALLALVQALLISTNQIQYWHVLAIALCTGSVMALIFPTRQTLTPATVEKNYLGRAIALNSAGMNSTRVIGPALGGILTSSVGLATCFYLQAAGLVGALFCTTSLHLPQPTTKKQVGSLREGLEYIKANPTLSALLSLAAVPTLLAMPYQQLLPVFARDVLHTGPEGLGLLMTANGAGALIGALTTARLGQARLLGKQLLIAALCFPLLLIAFAWSSWLPLSMFLLGIAGMCSSVYMATNNTLLHLNTDDALRGRVMSAYMFTWGLMPLGTLPQGTIAAIWGAPIAVTISAILCALFVLLVGSRRPQLLQVSGVTQSNEH